MQAPEPGAARLGVARRAWRSLTHSLRLRLVALFLLLALAMSAVFFGGMQRAIAIGWRDANPLVTDYVDRLVLELGTPPSMENAQAMVQRLPLSIRISGPVTQWDSHPDRSMHPPRGPSAHPPGPWGRPEWAHADHEGPKRPGPRLLERVTADGHRVEFGLSLGVWQDRPKRIGWFTLAALLGLTALAYLVVHRLLRPLKEISQGAKRFGQGQFDQPINSKRKDDLGDLAREVDHMARDIHGMLEAKRALLLAISHELRSPLTRARLNAELLPDRPELAEQRQALLRDLAQMRDLISDLLESERLASPHAALQRQSTDLSALARELVDSLNKGLDAKAQVLLQIEPELPLLELDASRMRLLLRNLLDNALRHSAEALQPPGLRIRRASQNAGAPSIDIEVRDHGPGVDEAVLAHLAEPFFRPDSARQRATGGVGLGLYLCKLVAQAHGGSLSLRNASPGLLATVSLPAPRSSD